MTVKTSISWWFCALNDDIWLIRVFLLSFKKKWDYFILSSFTSFSPRFVKISIYKLRRKRNRQVRVFQHCKLLLDFTSLCVKLFVFSLLCKRKNLNSYITNTPPQNKQTIPNPTLQKFSIPVKDCCKPGN